MRALLEHGARVDLPNVMGVTPLMVAAGVGVREPGFGANRSPDFTSKTIEDKAIASLTILLEAGADVNASVADLKSRTARIARGSSMTDRTGQTALHSAAGRGWTQVVTFLVERGANVGAADGLGRSPLDLALAKTGGVPVPNADLVAEILRNASASAGGPTASAKQL
jgi:ankyrin repeat protein